MQILRLVFLVLLWCLILPAAAVVAVVLSAPRILIAFLHALELFLDLAWLLVAICFHLLRSSLFALGLGGREKALLIRTQARHFAGEVMEDAKKLLALPAELARSFRRALTLVLSFFHRQAGRARDWAADRAAATILHRGAYGFEADYEIVERLPSGGSTAQVFVVLPRGPSRPPAAGSRGDRLVLKYFDLTIGSHLENIIRESGAVRLATQLGIVLDSKMTPNSFYYIMPYYHGATLTREVLAIHRRLPDGSRPADEDLGRFLGWLRDLLAVIVEYHERGVFHKDIKPDNLIVEGKDLYLVDIGLLTPLESTLQLTTHGTEYFRDPEMVRLAARQVTIRDVDCAKFDIYSIGAVLYFMADGGFPASGSLTRYSRPVPFPLQWISNRAMTDFDKRYASAREMLRDVDALRELSSSVPFASITVSNLPSFQAGEPPPAHASPSAPAAASALPPGPQDAASRKDAPRFLKLAAGAVLLAAGAAAGASLLYVNAEPLAPRAAGEARWRAVVADMVQDASVSRSESAALDDAASARRFSSRQEAARWVAEEIESLRQAPPHEVRGRTPLILPLPEPGEDPEASEFLRELKLALAQRGVPFVTRTEASAPGALEDVPWFLRLEAARRSGLRTIEGEVRTPSGPQGWHVEYP